MTRELVVDPIYVAVARETNHAAVVVRVGDCEVFIQATPKGRRVFISIDDGSVDVQTTRRRRDGSWT